MNLTHAMDDTRDNVAVTTAATTDAGRPAQGLQPAQPARAARIADLLDHRAFAPEAIGRRIDCALEAPLLGRPAFQRPVR